MRQIRKWNHGLIDGIFTMEEAKLIKSLPLSPTQEDTIFGPHTTNNVYTSKFGYIFLKQEASIDHLYTHHETEQTLWRSIWSLQVSNKVKNLLLRETQESLPTKQNLQRRTIMDCSLCDRCKLEPEIALHATWLCRELEVVWEDASVWGFRRSRSFLSFKELLSWLIMNT